MAVKHPTHTRNVLMPIFQSMTKPCFRLKRTEFIRVIQQTEKAVYMSPNEPKGFPLDGNDYVPKSWSKKAQSWHDIRTTHRKVHRFFPK